eukprot:633704-Rhodomonas_salina.2
MCRASGLQPNKTCRNPRLTVWALCLWGGVIGADCVLCDREQQRRERPRCDGGHADLEDHPRAQGVEPSCLLTCVQCALLRADGLALACGRWSLGWRLTLACGVR